MRCVRFTLYIGFWKACAVSNCYSMTHLRPIFESWSLAAPQAVRIRSSQRQGFAGCCYQKWPHDGSTGSSLCVLKGHLGLRESRLLPVTLHPPLPHFPPIPSPGILSGSGCYHPAVGRVFRKETGVWIPAPQRGGDP